MKMSDLIDRDEAIMAVKMGALSAATLYGRTDEGSTALYETVRAIKAIPSVQPETHDKRTETHACDCISRQAAINAPVRMVSEGIEWIPVYHVEQLPSAQPERMKGRWMRKNDGVYCSACYKGWDFMTGVPAEVETEYKFCPNCGADMRGEQDE